MRYRFRGLTRDTGRAVEGHVEAVAEQEAFNALSDNGIVTEGLWPDPKPLNLGPSEAPRYADAIDSAMDLASAQVPFDDLMDRYKGKRVWVIDRDKIRRRVAEVVDQAIHTGVQRSETGAEIRERVAEAIRGVFGDTRNIASQQQVGGQGINPQVNQILEQQLTRLNNVVRQAEGVLASLTLAARRIGSYGGGGGRSASASSGPGPSPSRRTRCCWRSSSTTWNWSGPSRIRRWARGTALPRPMHRAAGVPVPRLPNPLRPAPPSRFRGVPPFPPRQAPSLLRRRDSPAPAASDNPAPGRLCGPIPRAAAVPPHRKGCFGVYMAGKSPLLNPPCQRYACGALNVDFESDDGIWDGDHCAGGPSPCAQWPQQARNGLNR